MDTRLLAIIGVLFLAIGFFSTVVARKRLQVARALGQPAIWYKNLGLLTGIEYMLFGLLVFLRLPITNSWFPGQFTSLLSIVWTGILLLAIIFLVAVLFTWVRQPRQTSQIAQAVSTTETIDTQSSKERSAEETQRKRERRQKAAAARRRHAGRA
jgi:hypothetical protein